MRSIPVKAQADAFWLADQLADELSSDELIEFIVRMDDRVVDLQFTIALRDRLTAVIEAEG